MDSQPRRVALVTGASGGIGADLARVFARNGHDLALVARDSARLEALASEIAGFGCPRPMTIAQDLTAASAVDDLCAQIRAAGVDVQYLVNNAGYGLLGEAIALPRPAQLGMIDLNIRALTELTLACLPGLERTGGKILNVASVAAFMPGPGFAVYYASKAYVLSFSEALAQELRPRGISVSALCPGPTASDFQARAGFQSGSPLARMPMAQSMPVARAGYAGMMAGRRVIVPGLSNTLSAVLARLVPHGITLPVVAALQKKRVGSA